MVSTTFPVASVAVKSTGRIDMYRNGGLRYGDLRLQRISGCVDYVPVLVGLEAAGAGVNLLSAAKDLEKSVALYRHVQTVVCFSKIPLLRKAFRPTTSWFPYRSECPWGPLSLSWCRLPAGTMVWYMRSSKFPRLRLKPVVFAFARLLAITSMLVCWADIPVAAVQRLLILILRSSGPLSALDQTMPK